MQAKWFYCLLCQKRFRTQEGEICCFSCYLLLQKLRFLGCVSCGSQNADHPPCGVLYPEIDASFSIYSFQEPLSSLLNLAKNENIPDAVHFLEDFLYVVLRYELVELVKKYSYDTIVLAPLTQKRIFQYNWHPLFLTEKIIKSVINNQDNNVFCVDNKKKTKQSRLTLLERKSQRISFENSVLEIKLKERLKEGKSQISKVLIIDDVMTSGQTLQQLGSFIKYFTPVEFVHTFTIFRTPQ